MLTVLERPQHFPSLISCSSYKSDKAVYLVFGTVGCWKTQLAINHVDSYAVEKRIKGCWGRFEHIVPFVLGPSG